MAVLTVQAVVPGGTAISAASANGGGDSFPNTGRERLRVMNGSGAPIVVTIVAQKACSFGVSDAAHDITKSVAAGATVEMGPFDPARFNDTNDRVQVTYASVTSLTVAVTYNGSLGG